MVCRKSVALDLFGGHFLPLVFGRMFLPTFPIAFLILVPNRKVPSGHTPQRRPSTGVKPPRQQQQQQQPANKSRVLRPTNTTPVTCSIHCPLATGIGLCGHFACLAILKLMGSKPSWFWAAFCSSYLHCKISLNKSPAKVLHF